MENVKRIGQLLADAGHDWVVLTGADSVCFATGHIVPIEIGMSPFTGGPCTAFISKDGAVGVVAANVDGAQIDGLAYETYEGFARAVTDQPANYQNALASMLRQLGVSGSIAYEGGSLPASAVDLLGSDLMPFDKELARLRAVKTDREIAKLRKAAEVAAAGQEAARAQSVPGITELEVWGRIRTAMERAAGERCALAGEYLSGIERTSVLGLQPTERALQNGDPIVCDLAPRVSGYWGDSCSAFVVGNEPTEPYVKLFNASKETLDLAIAELRPGLRVCDFDAMLRANMQRHGFSYPHHSGHGIGTSVHEFPRLLPDETALIEENMVLMVEPGSYIPGLGGARCEFMLIVTATGCEVAAPFQMTI
ncbi:MAG: M24 family metallopeptidase [Hyphomicrobiales bacterium]